MFVEESVWIREILSSVPLYAGAEVLDIGSSNREFRTKVQPHIQENILLPLEARGARFTYIDVKDDEGVDLVLDLAIANQPDHIFNKKYDLIICCNILEHVADRSVFMRNLTRFAKEGGHILITAPHRYFRHNDPIDTMYRPLPRELCDLLGRFVSYTVKAEAMVSISEKRYYVFSWGRLLDYIPLRTHRHLWRYYFRPFRWQVSGILVEVGQGIVPAMMA